MIDPIVDEVRRARDAHAAKFNYDLDAIFQDIKEQEKNSGLTYVLFPPRSAEPGISSQPRDVAASDSHDSMSMTTAVAAEH